MTIITHPALIGGRTWWCARYPSGARAYGSTREAAIRNLREEFPDDEAQTLIDSTDD